MTANSPPYALQSGSHSAQLFRQAISTLLGSAGGIVDSGDYLVTQNGTPNMSVNVAGGVPGGRIWIPGTTSTGPQALYYGYNDATVNLAIAASNPSNPRIDRVVAQVQDASYAGAVNSFSLAVVTGTPAGSPVAPSAPASSLSLATVAVAALATTVVTANVTDTRVQANFAALPSLLSPAAVVTSLPGSPINGQEIYYRAALGVVWHLKWIAADAVWAKVGGGPLTVQYVGPQSSAGWNFNVFTIAANDPTITVPRAGVYKVSYEGAMASAPGSGTPTQFDVKLNVHGNQIASQPAPAAGVFTTMVLEDTPTFSVGDVVRIAHQVQGSGGGFSFMQHGGETLSVDPIYITG